MFAFSFLLRSNLGLHEVPDALGYSLAVDTFFFGLLLYPLAGHEVGWHEGLLDTAKTVIGQSAGDDASQKLFMLRLLSVPIIQ